LLKKFRAVDFYDGYTHENLEEILQGVHLGLVPVLWEDNLPQVAIEFKSLGIPVLASEYGGASELSKSTHFSFSAAKKGDFKNKLREIMDQPGLINDYWENGMPLKTIQEHVDELLELYEGV
jgi:glycosyltransferase involved in cell wall biosynthesis